MYIAIVLVFLFLPAAGVFLMEHGAYSIDLYVYGYRNGATLAYLLYVAVVLVTYFTLRGKVFRSHKLTKVRTEQIPEQAFVLLAQRILALHVVTLIFVLFVAGTIHAVTGQVGRGELRVSLGPAALPALFIRDYLVPGTAALVGLMYTLSPKSRRGAFWFSAVVLTTIIHGLSWGYRGLVIFMLIPLALLAVPKIRLRILLTGTVLCCMSVAIATSYYTNLPLAATPRLIFERVTVQTGGVPWRVWSVAQEGTVMPPYWKTLTGFLGNRLPVMLGLVNPKSDEDQTNSEWPAALFSITFGGAGGYSQTSNLTGTTFSEAIDAFGARGFLFFAVIVGGVIAFHRRLFDKATLRGNVPLLCVLSVYFKQSIVGWLNSGGVIALFHIVLLADYFIFYFCCRVLLENARLPSRVVLAVPSALRYRSSRVTASGLARTRPFTRI